MAARITSYKSSSLYVALMGRKRTQDDKHFARGRNQLLAKQPCEVCGATPAEGHHIDYASPERVMWLCKAHHAQTHSQFGRPAPEWMSDIRAAVARIDARRLAARIKSEDQAAPLNRSDSTES